MTQENPYQLVVFTMELAVAASHLLDAELLTNKSRSTGMNALLTVIEERLRLLSNMLDAGVFCEQWPELVEQIERDPTLGLLDKGDAA
jgi:hypothetical protein